MRRSAPLFALALLGCPAETSSPCSAEAIATCVVDQDACVMSGGAPSCVECGPGTRVSATTGTCEPIGGIPMRHDFPENSTVPGDEISGLCRSWTLDNEEEIWVNAVELEQDELSHHSNWIFAPEGMFDGPDGVWTCRDRGYDQLSGALAGGVLYAQSTQATHEVQLFAPGVAVRLPPHTRIISDIHVLNTGTEAVTGHATLTLYTLPRSEVTTALTPFHLEYHALEIPPHATSRFVAECAVGDTLRESLGPGPLPIRLHYSLPHTHSLGSRLFLEVIGGAHDGESLVDVYGYNGEARGILHDPPIDLSDMTGLRFGCEFENPRDETVGYGIGDQEMCEMLGFIESPYAFESRVSEAVPLSPDGDITVSGGACETLLIPWADRGL